MRQSGTEDTADIADMFHVIRGSNIFFCQIFTVFQIITLLKGISIGNMRETMWLFKDRMEHNTTGESYNVHIHIVT